MSEDSSNHGSSEVRLRPVHADDVDWMATMACDPELVGAHNWAGDERDHREVRRDLLKQLAADGMMGARSGVMIVELAAGTAIGEVSWRTERWGPSTRSQCPAFGIALLPQFRGRGFGTIAQSLLIDRLFTLDPDLHRIQSDTASDNLAEQRVLAKVGMVAEGVVRDAEFRDGRFHDHTLFSMLRSEWESRRG